MHIKLFWDYVDSSGGPDACWPWLRGHRSSGYGAVNLRTGRGVPLRGFAASRVAWALANDRDPCSMDRTEHVLHRCDNPPCCNPAHLYLGTHSENMADMVAKGRQGRRQRGEERPAHKLTEADVLAARAAYRAGDSTPVLAARYGVGQAAMYNAITGKTWAFLPGAVKAMRSSTQHLHGH